MHWLHPRAPPPLGEGPALQKRGRNITDQGSQLKSENVVSYHSSTLVLDRHRCGIDRFLAGDALDPGEDATVFILVALHSHAALLVTIGPSQADEVFLRFAECHKCPNPKREDTNSNGGTDSSMNILSVTDFGNRRSGDCYYRL